MYIKNKILTNLLHPACCCTNLAYPASKATLTFDKIARSYARGGELTGVRTSLSKVFSAFCKVKAIFTRLRKRISGLDRVYCRRTS